MCTHKGKVDVLTHHNGLLVSAGDRYIAPLLTDEVVLDLVGKAVPQFHIVGNAPLVQTRQYQTFTRIIMEWMDMSYPDVYRRFWDGLIEDIVKGRHNLVIMCYGGHGRTGTALAIMATLLDAIPPSECPVAWVRQHYCQEAVETKSQARYITDITGREVTTKFNFMSNQEGETKLLWN